MTILKTALIGMGALGIDFGGQLNNHYGKESVFFIADESRIKKYENMTIMRNDEVCDFRFTSPQNPEKVDLLIFCVKYGSLKNAIETARPFVGEGTVVISVLNGIASEPELEAAYAAESVVYCVAQGMDAQKTENGANFTKAGMFIIGEKDGRMSERVDAICEYFKSAGVEHLAVNDIIHRQWSKLMLNCGVNQCCMVYGANYGELFSRPEVNEVMLATMREVITVGRMEGVNLSESDIEFWIGVLNTLSKDNIPSMRQDAEARRKTEVDLFSGTIRKLGKKHGIPTPVSDMLWEKIAKIEAGF